MDVVIPLMDHTDNDYLDLRYALRGFDLYLKPSRVFLIGARPAWARNVEHIPAQDIMHNDQREYNMLRKLLLYPGEEFIYANDDHFLTQPWKEVYAWDMTITQKYYQYPHGSNYKRTLSNTLRFFPTGNYYDVHCPMLMHMTYLKMVTKLPWTMPFGFCLKSAYAAYAKLQGQQQADFKIRKPYGQREIAGRAWFSTADGIVEKSVKVMDRLYPKKSKYEA